MSEYQDAALLPLFRLSRDAVCGARNGQIVFANPAACRLFERDVTGENAESLFPGMSSAAESCALTAQIVVRGREMPVTGVLHDGLLLLTVQVEAFPPAPISAAALHRLRTGVFNLRLSLGRLTDPEKEEPDPRMKSLLHSYYYLTHLIDQLADLRELSCHDLPFQNAPMDLAALCRDLTDSVSYFVRDRGIELCCDVPDTVCVIRGDRERTEQLLLILLSNSLLHTPAGGRITLTLNKSGRKFILSLDDTGSGIADEDMAYIFSPREDGGIPSDGAGLGLSVANGLVRLMGGAMVLESSAGKGTRVRISLPESREFLLRDAESRVIGPEKLLRELSAVLRDEDYDPRLVE